jgi:hypothetical protein
MTMDEEALDDQITALEALDEEMDRRIDRLEELIGMIPLPPENVAS